MRHALRMEHLTDDELLLDLINSVAGDALARIGDNPEARYRFFREVLRLAEQAVALKSTAFAGS